MYAVCKCCKLMVKTEWFSRSIAQKHCQSYCNIYTFARICPFCHLLEMTCDLRPYYGMVTSVCLSLCSSRSKCIMKALINFKFGENIIAPLPSWSLCFRAERLEVKVTRAARKFDWLDAALFCFTVHDAGRRSALLRQPPPPPVIMLWLASVSILVQQVQLHTSLLYRRGHHISCRPYRRRHSCLFDFHYICSLKENKLKISRCALAILRTVSQTWKPECQVQQAAVKWTDGKRKF